MINFEMTTKENFASFIDPESGVMVFVDSFDNQEFDVRVGSLFESHPVGIIKAADDKTLNKKLSELYKIQVQQCQ
ncbi:hypothetical protein [Vibrio anguillarum]|uniref:hypothetical protein n=1 Tax=Vibrio anguillarum TaxID=55601 RepID=UPI00188C0600|nr:hypothetical protein [Vibrio anguillarum]MBF4366432.1 hypothetical protein [Vibrio anguillarum]